jgi:polysaccharide biosynthesis/export protein
MAKVFIFPATRLVGAFSVFALTLTCGVASVVAQEQTTPIVNPRVQAASIPAAKPENNAPSAPSTTALALGAADLVEVSVYNVPELSTKTRISSNGDIYLPLIDYVHVGGLTVDEAQTVIEKRLSDGGFVKDPHVTVFVDEYASGGASLLGEVAKPGVYQVLGQQRLFDLLSAAGGLTDKAGNSVTITHRGQPDRPLTLPLTRNLAQVPGTNVRVFPGDTIMVRQADIVYVVGAVQHPTGILMDRGSITVLQAIAMAGGTTSSSKMNQCKIIHKGANGLTETRVQLKKILEAKLPDVPMNPDDILFIPSSAFKDAVHNDASIALQASSVGLLAARY